MKLPHETRLEALGVGERDRNHVTAWLVAAEPGQSMLLARYGAPHIKVAVSDSGVINVSLVKQSKWHTRTST